MKTLLCLVLFLTYAFSAPPEVTPLRVVISDFGSYPFEYLENNKWVGFNIDVIESVAQTLNWKVTWVPIPWPKVYNTLYTDEADAASFLVKTPLRPEPNLIFLPDNILIYYRVSLFARQDFPHKISFKKNSFGNLAKFQIGTIPGGIADRWVSILYPEVVLNRTAKDAIQLYELLDKGRIDLVFGNPYLFRVATTANPKLKKTIREVSPPLIDNPAYFVFRNSPNGQKMAEDFGKGLKAFKKTHTYEELKTKYDIK